MTRGLRVEAEAEQELADAVDWYELQQPGLGAARIAEVDEAIARLRGGELPRVPVPGLRGDRLVRRVLLDRFPYAIVLLDTAEEVHVVAVAHLKRRPGYWSRRLRSRRT